MHTFKKIFRRASRGAAWPLHFKFVSYAYALAVSPQNGLKRSEILGGHVPTCHIPLARALRALYAHWNPPFQNPRSATECFEIGCSEMASEAFLGPKTSLEAFASVLAW